MNKQSNNDGLGTVFGFTLDDLNANRKGILNKQQMPTSKMFFLFIFPGGLLLLGILIVLGLLASWAWYGNDACLLMLILGGGAMSAQFRHAIRGYNTYKKSLVIKSLHNISKKDFLYKPFEEFSYKYKGEISLYLTSKQFEKLDENKYYNVYYLDSDGEEYDGYDVLTIEPLLD